MVVRRQLWNHLDQLSKQIEHQYSAAQNNNILEIRSTIQSTIVPQIRQVMSELKSQDLQTLLQSNLFLQKIQPKSTTISSSSSSSFSVTASINFLTLLKTPHSELSVFILPPNTTLPLHDHPDMDVCCHVLDGVLCEYSANWIPDGSKQTCKTQQAGSLDEEVKSQKKKGGKVICVSRGEIRADDSRGEAKLIQSHKNEGGVLHEFWTNENVGAVFIDFFTPTYYAQVDPGDALSFQRECTYFELIGGQDGNKSQMNLRQRSVGDVNDCIPMREEPKLNMQDLFAEMMSLRKTSTK